MKKKTGKRILSVTIKRMYDESPDISYLGEYSNRPTSQFSIDRASGEFQGDIDAGLEWLERVESCLDDMRGDLENSLDSDSATDACSVIEDNPEWNVLNDAIDCIRDLRAGEPFDALWDTREYCYFNPATVEPFDKKAEWLSKYSESERETEWRKAMRKNARQDYDRMESLNRGDWCYLGIRVDAEIMPNVQGTGDKWHGVCHKITSGGLWGIESDSEKSYLAEVEQDELENLRAELTALGFSRRAISKAFQNVERKDS